jgi:hypothetical protein
MMLVLSEQSHAITSIYQNLDAETQSADGIPGQFLAHGTGRRAADQGVDVDWPFPGLPGKNRQQNGTAGYWPQK